MKRFSISSLLFLACLLPACAVASVDLDQAQPGWYPDRPLVLGGPSQQRLAQSFKAGLSGQLDHVDLVMRCEPDSPGKVTVGIHHLDASGLPLPSAIGSTEVVASTLTTGTGFSVVSFDIPRVAMVAGDAYAVVMTAADSAQCSTAQGPPEGGFFTYPRGEALHWALPNPPGWFAFSPQAIDLPFWTYVDSGHPVEPRYCDFKDASGIANNWLQAHVPICGCLEDAVSRANRCWFVLPELTFWREFPLPLQDIGARVTYSVMPLTSGLSKLRIQEVGSSGDLIVAPVSVDKSLTPGKVLMQRAKLHGTSEGTLLNIRYDTPDGTVDAVFETRLAIPTGHQ